MSIKEQLHQKIESMTAAQLEWLDRVLLETDAEVERKLRLLDELAAPMLDEDITAFKQAVARQPWRSEAK